MKKEMDNKHYILNNKIPIECDLITWANWLENIENRRVAQDIFPNGRKVSTVFLGLDHNFGGGKPLLFETMVFKKEGLGGEELDIDRYSTWEEAEKGHQEMVKKYS